MLVFIYSVGGECHAIEMSCFLSEKNRINHTLRKLEYLEREDFIVKIDGLIYGLKKNVDVESDERFEKYTKEVLGRP